MPGRGGERPSNGHTDHALCVWPRMGILQQVVVPWRKLDFLRDPCKNHRVRATGEEGPSIHPGQSQPTYIHHDFGGSPVRRCRHLLVWH
ncbi:unnamed protein product [Gulo gulo]|uniref:Uncharacterized protein n=1 Tax=Gulo gulo TaxID=48420 RepID=A0A9X9LNS3_GULGU|nr:unnamed protein product [Gulo gulo]